MEISISGLLCLVNDWCSAAVKILCFFLVVKIPLVIVMIPAVDPAFYGSAEKADYDPCQKA